VTVSEGTDADLSGGSTACYADRKSDFRAFCGSIELLFGGGGSRIALVEIYRYRRAGDREK